MLLRLNVLSSMTTRKGFYLDATVHQRVVFTAVKRSFARVKKERTHGDICDDWNDGSRQNGLCGR